MADDISTDTAMILALAEEQRRKLETWPDLVEALEEVEEHLADVLPDDEPLLVKVRAALARAQGEKS